MKTSLSPKGQATIPKPVRDFLGLKPGDKVEWEIHYENDSVTLRTLSKKPKKSWQEGLKEIQKMMKGSNILEEYLEDKQLDIKLEDGEYTLKKSS